MNLPRVSASSRWRGDFGFVAVLVTGSVLVGWTINMARERPMSLPYQDKETRLTRSLRELGATASNPVPVAEVVPESISLESFDAIGSRVLVLDTRPPNFYRNGHVPGALNLPRRDLARAFESLKAHFETNRDRLWVVYCASQTCEDAERIRTALRELGYANVTVLSGGWAEWVARARPVERGP